MERKWWTLLVVCVAVFMLLLDITIVNVALPKIAEDLNASFTDIQWVIDAYALTLAALLLTTGTLADLLGRRRIFAIGLVLFSSTSLLCGLSPNATFLIFARAGQGIGGAVMFSTSLALIAQEFHGRDRGTAIGAYGATIAGSAAVGPLLGGVLTEAFGWQSIFYINVPVGIIAVVLTLTKVHESRNPAARRIDWIGTVTFTGALFLLVLAVIRGNAEGWGSTLIVSLFVAGGLLLVVFLISQLVQRDAMFDLTLFRKPAFDGAAVVAFTLSASMLSMFLYLTLYLQTILGLSPLQTGLRFLPVTVLAFFVAGVSGNLSTKVPVRLLLGLGLACLGAGLWMMRGLTASSDWTALLPGFIVAGIGLGLINPALASTAIGVVEPQRSGMASGINSTFRQVGIAAGTAVIGAIFESSITKQLGPKLVGSPVAGHAKQFGHAVAAGGSQTVLRSVPQAARAHAATAIHTVYASAMNEILLIAGIVAFVGAAMALVLVRGRDFVPMGSPEPAAAAAS